MWWQRQINYVASNFKGLTYHSLVINNNNIFILQHYYVFPCRVRCIGFVFPSVCLSVCLSHFANTISWERIRLDSSNLVCSYHTSVANTGLQMVDLDPLYKVNEAVDVFLCHPFKGKHIGFTVGVCLSVHLSHFFHTRTQEGIKQDSSNLICNYITIGSSIRL